MKYRINSENYTVIGPHADTLALKTTDTRRVLCIPSGGAGVLDSPDVWVSFEEKDGAKRRDMLNALKVLEAFNIADVEHDSAPDTDGCIIAGERHYRIISAFYKTAVSNPRTVLYTVSDGYLSEDSIRARQFNNKEYNFIRSDADGVCAVLTIGVPGTEQVDSAGRINNVAFRAGDDEDACRYSLEALVRFAAECFKGDLNKLRFIYTDPVQDWLRGFFENTGFKKTCTLEREIAKSLDVTFYDKML